MRRTLGQLLRYGLVGIASNALAYVSYLALTGAGMGHLSAMTLVYALATLLTFLFNRRWSFGHSGGRGPALASPVGMEEPRWGWEPRWQIPLGLKSSVGGSLANPLGLRSRSVVGEPRWDFPRKIRKFKTCKLPLPRLPNLFVGFLSEVICPPHPATRFTINT